MTSDKDSGNAVSLTRRGFLKSSVGVAGVAAATPFTSLMARPDDARRVPFDPGYGPLVDVRDEATGLPLLRLPEGFRYTSGANLETPLGTMAGRYGMIDANGEHFQATIPEFLLTTPRTLH